METKYQMETKQPPEENKPKLDVKSEYEPPLMLKHKPLRDVSGFKVVSETPEAIAP